MGTETSTDRQAVHAALPDTTHDEFARQEFVRSYKQYLVKHVHGGNRERYDREVRPAFEREHRRPPKDRFEVRDTMTRDPYYRMFSSLLRTSQEMMWSACQKPVEREFDALNERINGTPGRSPASSRSMRAS